jgi:hypothetical protein
VGYTDREEMLRLVKTNNPQLACLKHFELSHPRAESMIQLDGVGNHPNAWFAASMAYHKAQREKDGGGNKDKDKKAEGASQPVRSRARAFAALVGGRGLEGRSRCLLFVFVGLDPQTEAGCWQGAGGESQAETAESAMEVDQDTAMEEAC